MRSSVRDRGVVTVFLVLALLGVGVALARLLHVEDLLTLAEPNRQRLMMALGLRDGFSHARLADARRFDRRFADHRLATILHVGLAVPLLVAGAVQFSGTVRTRYPAYHRWAGRALVGLALVVVVSGMFFGVLMPFGGLLEAVAIAGFGGFCIFALARAWLAIRRRRVASHREWMIRAFAVLVGVSTVRILGGIYDFTLAPLGVEATHVFVLSIWTGFGITLLGAEAWIRRSRRRSPAPATSGSASPITAAVSRPAAGG